MPTYDRVIRARLAALVASLSLSTTTVSKRLGKDSRWLAKKLTTGRGGTPLRLSEVSEILEVLGQPVTILENTVLRDDRDVQILEVLERRTACQLTTGETRIVAELGGKVRVRRRLACLRDQGAIDESPMGYQITTLGLLALHHVRGSDDEQPRTDHRPAEQ